MMDRRIALFLGLFAGLYFVQGAILAFLGNFQKPFLVSQGVEISRIALLTSLLILPFILKIFFGMLSDRVSFFGFGYRKPYILIGLSLGAIGFWGSTCFAPATQFFLFAALILAAIFGLALFDTAIDGYAIDVAKESEQSWIQAAMIAGKALGYISMSAFFGWISERWGYGPIYSLLAIFVAVAAVLMLRLREPERRATTVTTNGVELNEEGDKNWRLPPLLDSLYFLFGISYSVVSFGADGVISLFLMDRFQVSSQQIGIYGSFRGLGALVGAGLAALILRFAGRRLGSFLGLVFLGLGLGLWAKMDSLNYFFWVSFVWGTAWAYQETVFVTVAMGLARGAWSATIFALFMMSSNIGTSLGEWWVTGAVVEMGFSPLFTRLIWLLAPAAACLCLFFRIEGLGLATRTKAR